MPVSSGGAHIRGELRAGSGRRALLLFVVSTLVYHANFREIGGTDTYPTRLLPYVVLRYQRLDFDALIGTTPPAGLLPYYLQYASGHYYSSYPILPGLLSLPVYAVPFTLRGGLSIPGTKPLAKISAALLAALSVVFVYLSVRHLEGEPAATIISTVYAFGTSTWSVSSQALWGHGPAALFLAVAVYALVRADSRPVLLWLAGLSIGLMVACRPTLGVAAGTLLAYALWRHRRWGAVAGLAAALAVAPFLAYNVFAFGSVQGGYQWINATHRQFHGVDGVWSTPLGIGLLGILVSPSRGLLVYSPVLVFGLAGAILVWTHPCRHLLAPLAVALGVTILMLAKYSVWWGGHAYGPRLLTDVLPLLAILIVPVWTRIERSRAQTAVFTGLFAVSVGIQAIGAFYYPSPREVDWNSAPRDVDAAHERLWDWRDAQIPRLIRNGPRPLPLGLGVPGP
jgi:hypothetical protein